jgi:hypothetical protein
MTPAAQTRPPEAMRSARFRLFLEDALMKGKKFKLVDAIVNNIIFAQDPTHLGHNCCSF